MSEAKGNTENKEGKGKRKFRRSLFHIAVDVFVGILIFAVVVILLAIGAMQTSTFREYLRDEIVSAVNNEINGKFYLNELNGTILTSLELKDVGVIEDADTVFSANRISLSVSLIPLIERKILVRKFELDSPIIEIKEYKKNKFSLVDLLENKTEKDSSINETIEKQEEDKSGNFRFKIQINELKISNGSFVYKDFLHLASDSVYRHINYNDIQLKNLNVNLAAIINLAKNDFYLDLKNISFDDNLQYFKLKNLSANIFLNNNFTEVKNLTLTTDLTDIKFSAKMNNFSLLNNPELKKNLPVVANLEINNFNFYDLNTFLPSLDFLNGDVKGTLSVDGKYGSMNIKKLDLLVNETELKLKGKLLNLENAEHLFIEANINGKINYDDVTNLLAGLDLPKFNNLVVDKVDLRYKGEPLKFNSEINAKIDTSSLHVKAFMDMTKDEIAYNYDITTKSLDLLPIVSLPSKLNLKAKIKGRGFSLPTMKNHIDLKIRNSIFDGKRISNLSLNSESDSGLVNLNFYGRMNKALVTARGNLIADSSVHHINLSGKCKNLDLAYVLDDLQYSSDLNFVYNFNVSNIGKKDIFGEANIEFDSTVFKGSKALSGTDFSFSIWRDSTQKHIELKSALADAEITGNYDYEQLPGILSTQAERLLGILNQNIVAKISGANDENKFPDIPKNNVNIHYNIIFNSSDFWAKLLNSKAFSIAGYSFGSITNTKDKFLFDNNSFISNFIYINKNKDLIYVDNANIKANIRNSNKTNSIDSLDFITSISGNKVIAGSEFTDFETSFSIHDKKLLFSLSGTMDSLFTFTSSGDIVVSKLADSLSIDFLKVGMNNVFLENTTSAKVVFNNGDISFKRFNLKSDSANIDLSGDLFTTSDKNSDLNLVVNNLHLAKLEKMLFAKEDIFDGVLNGKLNLKGKITSPQITSGIVCNNFSYGKAVFGNVYLKSKYNNSRTEMDLKMLDESDAKKELVFSINGYLNKSLFSEPQVTENVNLHMYSKGFNLAVLAPLTEDVQHIHGNLNADVNLTGSLEHPVLNGFAELNGGKFYVTANGLDYLAEGKILFKKNEIAFENFYLANDPSTGFKGRVDIDGSASIDNFDLSSVNLNIHGGLGLLSDKTKFVNPYFYGNLFVKTLGKWKLDISNNRAKLTGKMNIEDADITISSAKSSSEIEIANIEYQYVVDSTQIVSNKAQELLKKYLSSQIENGNENEKKKNSFFDYDLTFEIENRATLNFIFSKVANQKLRAITTGSIRISSENGQSITQGEFTLLPGSRLDFFRTFEATGKIRFEREILNPYLDITAIYKGVHYRQSVSSNGIEEENVAVKIKLQGLLKNLGENLSKDKSKVAVYVGKKNIDNDVPDPKLDASDAMTFILFGKFNNDLTSSEQYKFSNELTSSATAMLGTVMGVFLNSTFGDLINDVDISKTQSKTKIMLKGRLGRFYYSFGGSQSVFQDIAQATWKMEYFFNKNLSLRVERREPITGYVSNKQMTDEIGIKYRVSF